ncbi:MAG: mono/diheme cytochrome c family protein [Pirellulaceae bacterium]|jgi:mono/diheme cytochrome c family protein
MIVKSKFLIMVAICFIMLKPVSSTAAESQSSAFDSRAKQFFDSNCISCHGEKTQEGDVTLHDIAMDFKSAEESRRWLTVLSQLENGEMPPADEEQPSHAERERMIAEIKNQFRQAGNPIELLRSAPKYGNYVNHRALFSGEHKGPSFSRPRIWRISPYIDGQSSPFSLSQEEGFKDYALMWSMDKPTIELLLVKANSAVRIQIGPSESDLKIQDEIWKQQTLTKRRGLQNDIKAQEARIAKDPENAGHRKRLESIAKQLEKNEATDFERDRNRPSNKLAGLQKNVFWRIAYGNELPPQVDLDEAVTRQLKTALRREPSADDIVKMSARLKESITSYGNETGMHLTMTSILLMPESIYRMEMGLGEKTPDGRRMLSQAEIAYALGYALTDVGPDKEIMNDLGGEKLGDPEVIRAHVERIYDSAITGTSKRKGRAERVLRFFQEYFAYQGATDVFKDGTRHPGHMPRPSDLIKDTDLLIMHVLKQDKDVLNELLTTDIAYIRHVPARPGWETISSYNVTKKAVRADYLITGEKNQNNQRYVMQLAGQRAGILTQPSWLTAHSTNFDNDPVKRGKWIYEHLLGGIIPDLPITVDAVVPEDPDKALRVRFEKTRDAYCQKCHAKMNPLGMAFEMFDDVGRFREEELLRDNKTLVKVDSSGGIGQSGVPELDGPVDDALELMNKLGDSPHVRQVFVRHAFRYWMGRNETLDDSPTLMAADKAYVESDGSMKALIASLLSSESFLYRKDLNPGH